MRTIEWMKEGKSVRRESWGNKELRGNRKDLLINFEDKRGCCSAKFLHDIANLEAQDWEIFEEYPPLKICGKCGLICEDIPDKNVYSLCSCKKESLSEKIQTFGSITDKYYEEKDIKEKIFNAKKRLKEDVENNFIGENPKKITINNVLYYIDSIFEEEFGDAFR